jgi:hypothetical protein
MEKYPIVGCTRELLQQVPDWIQPKEVQLQKGRGYYD